ncbi:hypothetical protein C815_00795 [Firmicutes bacterium M10-2]|nr:hypothetical protein C815_00795 [Firmicutes bacterium M10-2]
MSLLSKFKEKKLRKQFESHYEVALSSEFKIENSHHAVYPGRFILRFPQWKYAKADGTKDHRKKENQIVRQASVLWIDSIRVICLDVFQMNDLVNHLRAKGWAITSCKEEIEKSKKRKEEWECSFEDITIKKLLSRFEKNPTRFEVYCGMLFEKLGYEIKVTPPVNDGGYDLYVFKGGTPFGLAECKLYAPSTKVSRPVIQKLVGANEIEKAPHLFVITTSSFTKEAVEYAAYTNVELIDGKKILEMIVKIFDRSEIPEPGLLPLETEDLFRYMPEDLRNELKKAK